MAGFQPETLDQMFRDHEASEQAQCIWTSQFWLLLFYVDHQVKGQINLKSMHLKPHFFLSRGQTRKQFEGPLRTFVTVVTRSPSDLNNTNNHMSGPMFSCNLHIKYQLLFSYLRKHAKHAVFIIIVHLQNEKPNYNRKKKILVLGKMNLIIIQRGRQ